MPDLHLTFSFPTFFLFLAILVSGFVSWFAYRSTVPPVPAPLRRTMMFLRALAMVCLSIVLGEPLLSLFMHSTENPIVLVLADNSKSMTIRDRSGVRSESLLNVLQSDELKELSMIGEVRYALFSSNARILSSFSKDSLTLDGDATDISAALKSVKENASSQNVQCVLLISDGNSTTGTNPVYEAEDLNLPISTVGIGDTTEQQDLLIRSVLTNDIAYVGSRVPVRATIRSSGYGGERVEVTLRQGTATLNRQILQLENGAREYTISTSFVPDKEGVQRYSVEVSHLDGELTDENNRMPFFTKVLKSKMRVVLVTGGPSPDVTFLRRALAADNNIELRTFIGRDGGAFYEGVLNNDSLAAEDCIVLVGFPDASTPTSTLAAITGAANSGKPLLFLCSRTLDVNKLRELEPVLPFLVQQVVQNELQTFVTIPDPQRNNPVLKISGVTNVPDVWSKLPPIFRLQSAFHLKPESEVLGVSRVQSTTLTEPLIVSRSVNQKKSIAVLGYGLWRWTMLSDAGSGSETVLNQFVENAVRWLTTREEGRRLRVKPAKDIFSAQDPVEFTAQAYDESYQPTDDAQIIVTVNRNGHSSQLLLSPLGNGQFESSLGQLEAGDYSYTAKFVQDGRTVGEGQGTFSVGGLNAEFLDTKMNQAQLMQIAVRTGGKYYNPRNLKDLRSDIAALPNFKPRALVLSAEIELWNSRWLLGLVVALLSVEWFLRKRSGML